MTGRQGWRTAARPIGISMIIYPAALKKALGISMKDAYEILEKRVDKGLLVPVLIAVCPYCHRLSGHHYRTLVEIPGMMRCESCGHLIHDPEMTAIVAYETKNSVK